jgi:asparagine synthase (glutamine-hydrolysing)
MARSMVHRGPDDDGVHVDREAGFALGARRLSIIDVAGGHQPVSNEDSTVWAALNGEIYNHPSLQAHLRRRGHELRSGVDTEVLVHLYEEYGDAMLHALEGMFAFALWDARRQRLLIGRDRFGEKPLFFSHRAGELRFASELTALLAPGGIDADLDRQAVDAFLVFGYVPGPGSILRGIRQLPPAHTLVWERATGEVKVERYWRPPVATSFSDEPRAEVLAEAERLLDASVRSRLVADVPVGVFLSGGVDSTLIAALAARAASGRVKTFTVGYADGSVNETEAARLTADALGTDHHEIVLDRDSVAARVPSVLASLDQPLADQALMPLHAVAEFARREVTVAIGGEGADELFGGYPRYRWLSRKVPFGGLLPASAPRAAVGRGSAHGKAERLSRLAEVLSRQSLSDRNLDWISARRRHLRDGLYGPAMAGFDPNAVSDTLAGRAHSLNGVAPATALMHADQLQWLPDDVLMKADRAGMLVSLEVRTPYLHRELAEFAGTVSLQHHLEPTGKSILRELLGKTLPERPSGRKTAFRAPASGWLRGPLAPLFEDQLRSGAVYSEGLLDRAAVRGMFERHRAGSGDFAFALWPVLALGVWLDAFRGRA